MRKLSALVIILAISMPLFAQKKSKAKQEQPRFTVVKENPITSIKNQASSGTCWSFSGLALLESELIRMGKGEHDLSAMYIVRNNYEKKAQRFVRLNGWLNFAAGGAFVDVIQNIDEAGLVPTEAYEGLNYGETRHVHGEMDAALAGYVKAIIQNKNRKLTTAWFDGYKGIMDAYLGKVPTEFNYQGKKYTPRSFADELGLKASDYISLTSYTHHPFYSKFAIEIPDNWRWTESYNLPIDELMQVIDNAINNGFTLAWGSDVSEDGFTRNGLALIPDEEATENIGSDQAHWLGLSQNDKRAAIRAKMEAGHVKEKTITQEMRQIAYDNYETTDDHGMQMYGIAKDKEGTKYYMIKNSWGTNNKYKGIWYISEAFVKYKTMNIVLHKDALPAEIAKKLSL